jgi:ADP-heptose:LPS heptosyltransferase
MGVPSDRIALCHPGSGGLAKCCPLEALERFRSTLNDEGWTTAWMIGPDEMERFGDAYARRLATSAPVIFEESVERAADLVCGAQLFVGNDAGMTHVAALAGVRTIALFGPTDARVWRPLGPRVQVVPFPDSARPLDPWLSQCINAVERTARTPSDIA